MLRGPSRRSLARPLPVLCAVVVSAAALAGCGQITVTPTGAAATSSAATGSTAPGSPAATAPPPAPGATGATTGDSQDVMVPASRVEHFTEHGGVVIEGSHLTLVFANGSTVTYDVGATIPTTTPIDLDVPGRGHLSVAKDFAQVRYQAMDRPGMAYWSPDGSGSVLSADGSVQVSADQRVFCQLAGAVANRFVDAAGSAVVVDPSGVAVIGKDGILQGRDVAGVDLADLAGRFSACNVDATSSIAMSSDVLFDFDKATLTPAGAKLIDSIAPSVRTAAKGRPVTVVGHTDAKGSNAYNLDLGQRRADTVAQRLRTLIPGVQITATSQGESQPIAPNLTPAGADNPAGRAKNRRVVIGWSATG